LTELCPRRRRVPPANNVVVGTGDFNGDGHLDIALQDTTNGRITLWPMNAGTRLGAVATARLSGLSITPTPGSTMSVVGPR